MTNNKTPYSNIEQRLEELKDVPSRNPLQAASGRKRFLGEAAKYEQAVSPEKKMRQRGWIFPIRKEKLAMKTLVSLILVASLLLGGGVTVASAQNDLPNQPLYQLKLWTEDATLALKNDPEEKANLLLEMAETRLEEIDALTDMEITPPEEVSERLEEHLNQALELAEDLNEENGEQLLLDLQEIIQDYNAEDMEALRDRVREMLQEHLQLTDEDLDEFEKIHEQMQEQVQEQMQEIGLDEESFKSWLDDHPSDEFDFEDENFEELWNEMMDKPSMFESFEWDSENGFGHEFLDEYQQDFHNGGGDFEPDMDWGNGDGWGGFH